MESLSFTVEAASAGERVDVFLARHVEGLGRARAKELFEHGAVRVNGRRVVKGARLREGDVIALGETPSPARFVASPDPALHLSVVYEDADLVVVDKPAHVASQPLRAEELGTIANALVARYPEMALVGHSPREPGIVHRLDRGTSGLLVAARTVEAFERLVAALREGRIDKRYRALVVGVPRDGIALEGAIVPDPKDARRVRVESEPASDAPVARTEILAVNALSASYAEVEVRARSARRHQVRVQLAHAGHPLLGDVLYGGPLLFGLDRHALHASHLGFRHPRTGEPIELTSPLPPDLRAARSEAKLG